MPFIYGRLLSRTAMTGQIVLFGLAGDLVPRPAANTVLLPCIQLKKFRLGIALVACFSIGLALRMVSAGTGRVARGGPLVRVRRLRPVGPLRLDRADRAVQALHGPARLEGHPARRREPCSRPYTGRRMTGPSPPHQARVLRAGILSPAGCDVGTGF